MRILITGAGGAAAISVWKSLGADHELHMADMDPLAAGLYLVPPDRRLIIPRGDTPELVPALHKACKERRIEALLPTVDAELAPVAAVRDSFAAICASSWKRPAAVSASMSSAGSTSLIANCPPSELWFASQTSPMAPFPRSFTSSYLPAMTCPTSMFTLDPERRAACPAPGEDTGLGC